MDGAADILQLDATAQLHALTTMRIGAFELLEACQNALNSRNMRVNAVVAADFERAQERARAIDDKRARGDPLGGLAGLPITVKDSFDVDGLPASAGREDLRRRKAVDAHCVRLARAQDAVIWGKTNVPALERDWQTSGGVYGATNNPWDLARTAGGSSGGSAAAVASALTALDIGSDSSGGLRIPASYCGVFAHRPTPGLVNSLGHVPPWPGAQAERELRAPGPVARSSRDLRLLLSVMTEAPIPAVAVSADLKDIKVGLWLDEPAFPLDPECRAPIEAFADRLSAIGVQVRPISSPVVTKALTDTFAAFLFMTEAEDIAPAVFWREGLVYGPAAIARMVGARPWSWAGEVLGHRASHRAWLAADEARARMRQIARETFNVCHVILAPCAPMAPFAHHPQGQPLKMSDGKAIPYAAMGDWNALATVCGLPATVIPAGLTLAGLPVGVQIIGPRGGDSRTLAVAQAIEDSLGGFVPPPQRQES